MHGAGRDKLMSTNPFPQFIVGPKVVHSFCKKVVNDPTVKEL